MIFSAVIKDRQPKLLLEISLTNDQTFDLARQSDGNDLTTICFSIGKSWTKPSTPWRRFLMTSFQKEKKVLNIFDYVFVL